MATDKNYLIFSDAHLHNWSAFSGTDSEGRNIRLMHIIGEIQRHADYAKSQGIRTMYCAGDLFHTRGRVSPSVLNPALDLFKGITEAGITVRMIPGNHDLESEKTNRLSNASAALEGVGVELAHEPVYYMDNDVLMVPWNPNSAELLDTLKKMRGSCTEETDVIIHAPVNGVILGIPDHGLYPSELSALGYKRVFVGHYHAFKEFDDGVYSIGATTHQTWNDPGTLAGAIEVRGDEVDHRPTKAPMFIDLNGLTQEEIEAQTPGNYVRLKVGEASESDIKAARSELENLGALGVSIQSTPATKIVQRTTTVKAGGRIEESIDSWVTNNLANSDQKAVTKEALDVLSAVEDDE